MELNFHISNTFQQNMARDLIEKPVSKKNCFKCNLVQTPNIPEEVKEYMISMVGPDVYNLIMSYVFQLMIHERKTNMIRELSQKIPIKFSFLISFENTSFYGVGVITDGARIMNLLNVYPNHLFDQCLHSLTLWYLFKKKKLKIVIENCFAALNLDSLEYFWNVPYSKNREEWVNRLLLYLGYTGQFMSFIPTGQVALFMDTTTANYGFMDSNTA